MEATQSLSPLSLLHLYLTLTSSPPPPFFFHAFISFIPFCSYLHKVNIFLLLFPLFSPFPPPLPLEPHWSDLEHEIKILVSDITEYFQPKKIHSAINIKGHLEGRLTSKTLQFSLKSRNNIKFYSNLNELPCF